MNYERLRRMPFRDLYPLYVNKAMKKGRTEEEVIKVISWLTGYNASEIIKSTKDLESFYNDAPAFNVNATLITGKVCGVTVETIEDPLLKRIRYMDKLIDELAKGKPLEKILRK